MCEIVPAILSVHRMAAVTHCVSYCCVRASSDLSPAPYLTGSSTFEVVDLFTYAEGPADFPYIFSFLITVSPL